jgi:hypothetical protein
MCSAGTLGAGRLAMTTKAPVRAGWLWLMTRRRRSVHGDSERVNARGTRSPVRRTVDQVCSPHCYAQHSPVAMTLPAAAVTTWPPTKTDDDYPITKEDFLFFTHAYAILTWTPSSAHMGGDRFGRRSGPAYSVATSSKRLKLKKPEPDELQQQEPILVSSPVPFDGL